MSVAGDRRLQRREGRAVCGDLEPSQALWQPDGREGRQERGLQRPRHGVGRRAGQLRRELRLAQVRAELQAERRRSADKVQLYRQRRQQEKSAATKLQAQIRARDPVGGGPRPRASAPALLRSCAPALLRSCAPVLLRSCASAFLDGMDGMAG